MKNPPQEKRLRRFLDPAGAPQNRLCPPPPRLRKKGTLFAAGTFCFGKSTFELYHFLYFTLKHLYFAAVFFRRIPV